MIGILIQIVHLITRVASILVIVDVILSYFMSPYHTVRQTVDRLVEPMLAPIRRVVPPVGMLDLSPIILIILIQVIDYLFTTILYSIG